MITLIQASNAAWHRAELDGMHRLRADIFHTRMGWPVTVEEGRERDTFDDLNPLYIVGTNPLGEVVSSARLLPTTGPNMVADVFSSLLPDGIAVRSPLIWESSRFSVLTQISEKRSDLLIHNRTAELLCGIIEVGLVAGLDYIVSVVDVSVERVLRRAGCPCERLGSPGRIGRSLAIAGMFPMTEQLLASVRSAGGITGSVLDPDAHHAVTLAA
jgi:acyl homoserine lactone synthase